MTTRQTDPFTSGELSEEVPPDALALIESMRAYGYTLPTAIADLVDNSIAAQAKHVWLHFHWSGTESFISIRDDGLGMSENTLRDAMRLGSQSPLVERDSTDLGRFGLGLKTASLSQCRRLTVASQTVPDSYAVRRWDLEFLSRHHSRGWHLLKDAHEESVSRVRPPDGTKRGTVVLWEVLDRLVGNAAADNLRVKRRFEQLIEDVEQHLALVFHRFLAGGPSRLHILINSNEVQPWDPFLEQHQATQKTATEDVFLSGHDEPIRVRGFVLPHKDMLGDKAHRAASGPARWNAQQGFYVYRNRRLIVPGGWLGLGTDRRWTKEEHYKLARIRVDIPNSMDHYWQLDVKKSSAHPPTQVRDRLKGLAVTVRKQARDVFAHRGKHGRGSRHAEVQRAWRVVRRDGLVQYQIDRAHPLITVLGATSKTVRDSLEALLRVIEETVPVEQIWLDAAEATDSPREPFQGNAGHLRKAIELTYDAIRRNRDLSHTEAVATLLEREEYSSHEAKAIIGTLNSKGSQ